MDISKFPMYDTTVKYRGFYNVDKHEPLRRNQLITIKKGTLVRDGKNVVKAASRKQHIKINSFNCGMSICVGHFHETSGHVSLHYQSKYDNETVMRTYGTEVLEDLWPLMTVKRYDDSNVGSIFLPISNPEIVYAGSGGYWKYIDINQLV